MNITVSTVTGALGKYNMLSVGILFFSKKIITVALMIYPNISDPESPINILRLLRPKTLYRKNTVSEPMTAKHITE